MRRMIRGSLARRKRPSVGEVWPIYPGSERPPDGWPGWPEGKRFAFILSHDVEGERGLANCQRLADLEKKLGFCSSFNFIPEGGYQAPQELRESLRSQGFEVGVHDLRHDGKLYHGRDEFSRRAVRINSYLKDWQAVGFRSGFMFHNLEWLHDLDIEYDASTFDTDPFEPQPDAARTIFPFWNAGPNGKGYVELPYTLAQDSTLFLLLKEKTTEIWTRKLEWVAAHGGMALVNVHPDYVDFDNKPASFTTYPVRHYVEFLEWVRKQYAEKYWNCLPRELALWYSRQHDLKPRA
jgi:peptidoglycan/xylan/chitin deacetylase (PgdA/CDA1 family)